MNITILLLTLSILIRVSIASAQTTCREVFSSEKASAFYLTDRNLTPAEERILSNLTFNRAGTFNRFGSLEGMDAEIFKFLTEEVGSSDASANETVALAIQRIALEVTQQQGAEAAWFTLRVTKPNQEFDIPRWHIDGQFFDSSEPTFKYAQTLKGPSTLLIEVPEAIRNQLIEFSRQKNLTEQEKRTRIMHLLKPYTVVQPGTSQGFYFSVGDLKTSAIHSEPPMRQDRIFFSIVAGTKKQIQSLSDRWGIK